jgi:peptidoglycan hydrolase-like protein with peptidoglycan-binding domain
MFEYVNDLGLKPARPYTKRTKTDMIILHHFAGDGNVLSVHAQHILKGDRGIDYNIVVQLDGVAVWGRGIEYEGGHVRNYGVSDGMNARSIGICCQGNFDERKMPTEQKETLFRVIRDCLKKYTTIKTIVGHGDLYATACPGKNYPLKEAKALLDETTTVDETPTVAEKSEPAKVKLLKKGSKGSGVKAVQTKLIKLGYNTGSADGIYGTLTEKAVRAFQTDAGITVDGVVGPQTEAALDKAKPRTTTFRLGVVLKKGNRGGAVRNVQKALKTFGYSPGMIDSVFGIKTEEAVKKFQAANGLTVDGIVGKITTTALGGKWSG